MSAGFCVARVSSPRQSHSRARALSPLPRYSGGGPGWGLSGRERTPSPTLPRSTGGGRKENTTALGWKPVLQMLLLSIACIARGAEKQQPLITEGPEHKLVYRAESNGD